MQEAPVFLLSSRPESEPADWWGELLVGGAGSIERYVDAERGPLACITVSPPAAATTTVLRSIVSISIHVAARSMQHQKSADGSRSCAADVYWNTRDFVTQHFASGTLQNLEKCVYKLMDVLTHPSRRAPVRSVVRWPVYCWSNQHHSRLFIFSRLALARVWCVTVFAFFSPTTHRVTFLRHTTADLELELWSTGSTSSQEIWRVCFEDDILS